MAGERGCRSAGEADRCERAATRLARPGLAPVLDELVRRLGDGPAPVTLVIDGMSIAERGAVADLLGRARLPAATVRLRVANLADALGLRSSDDLRAVAEQLRGPIVDRRAERNAVRAERDDLWRWLADESATIPLLENPAVRATWIAGCAPAGPAVGSPPIARV